MSDMSSVLVQDLLKSNFNDTSMPAITYGEYDGVYDENIDYIDSVGIGSDNNIYLAKSYEELNSLRHNESYIRYSLTGISSIKELIYGMEFLLINLEGYEKTSEIYVKDYKGYVLPVKYVMVDMDADRVVFITRRSV